MNEIAVVSDPFDSILDPNGNTGGNPLDSLWSPNDSIWIDPFDSLLDPDGNTGGNGNPLDSLWNPNDSTWIDPFDSLWNPNDSIWIDPFDSLWNPNDSIWIDPFDSLWDPNDSIWIDPYDSLWNPNDSIWIDPFDSLWNPNDSIWIDPSDSIWNPNDSIWIDPNGNNPLDSLGLGAWIWDSTILNDSLIDIILTWDFNDWDYDLFDSVFTDGLDCGNDFDDIDDLLDSLDNNYVIDFDDLWNDFNDSLINNNIVVFSDDQLDDLWGDFLLIMLQNPIGTNISFDGLVDLFGDYLAQKASTILLSVEDIEDVDITVFPNPATDYIQVEMSDNKTYQVRILDISGKTLQQMEFENSTQVNVLELPRGQYILQISNSVKNHTTSFIKN
jgi:hypothetical protein